MANPDMNNLPYRLLDLLKEKEYQDVEGLYAGWANDFHSHGSERTNQLFSEICLDQLMLAMADVECGDFFAAKSILMVLSNAVKTSACVKRVLRSRTVLEKMKQVFHAAMYMMKKHPTRTVGNIIQGGWIFFMKIINGSHSNQELFQHLFGGSFDYDTLLDMHGNDDVVPEWSSQEEIWLIVMTTLNVLVHIHDINIRFTPKMKRARLFFAGNRPNTPWGKKAIAPLPYQRLSNCVGGFDYVVCCSLPTCDAAADKDGVLKHCGQCKMARYCSPECQRKHWAVHKTECLLLKDAAPADMAVVSWCVKRSFCAVHECR